MLRRWDSPRGKETRGQVRNRTSLAEDFRTEKEEGVLSSERWKRHLDAVEAGGRGGKEAEAGARIIASLLVHFLAASDDKNRKYKISCFPGFFALFIESLFFTNWFVIGLTNWSLRDSIIVLLSQGSKTRHMKSPVV